MKGQQHKDRIIAYKKTFNSDYGKQVLEDLKSTCNYGKTVYQPGCSPIDSAFEQGRQAVINEIMFMLSIEQN
jgi:hypothetical protein